MNELKKQIMEIIGNIDLSAAEKLFEIERLCENDGHLQNN